MLYVHIPFCRRKCLYCDFYSVGSRLADWKALTDAILAEGEFCAPQIAVQPLHSLYIGGGTPSLIPDKEFLRLADGLLKLQPNPVEFTIEVNPDDVTTEKSSLWKNCGVNRVSMGVQSLVDSELRAVGRRHDSATALRAYEILRKDFDNVSLDLMFGLPGQTLKSLDDTLSGFVAMRPEHLSAYSLMYEERTALTRMRDIGKISEAPEEESGAMFELISSRLAAVGYEQYEISNYSLPGRRSIHNSGYWRREPYTGLGPSAHSFDGVRTRSHNLPDIKRYVEAWRTGSRADATDLRQIEVLSDEELREEMIMTRLRTREGLDLGAFRARFGDAALAELITKAERAARNGLLSLEDSSISLTHKGIMVSDEIITDLW